MGTGSAFVFFGDQHVRGGRPSNNLAVVIVTIYTWRLPRLAALISYNARVSKEDHKQANKPPSNLEKHPCKQQADAHAPKFARTDTTCAYTRNDTK